MRLLYSFISNANYAIDLITTHLHKFRIEDSIVISGSPRSGTTWLMELLKTLPDYKSIFEPLHLAGWYPEFQNIGLPYHDAYVPIGEDYSKLKEYLKNVFTGQVAGKLPFYQYLKLRSIIRRFTASKLVVKFIKANTILPWIASTFNLRAVYYVLRHPCATVASQLATGVIPRTTKEQLLNEVNKIPELAESEELAKRLKSINSEIGRLAAIWAFQNYIPLASEKPYPWYTVVYERLVRNPEEELESIFGYIKESVPTTAWKLVESPSIVTNKSYGKNYIGTPKQLIKWRKKLSERQIREILEIALWFGLNFYNNDPEPDYDTLKNWKPQF